MALNYHDMISSIANQLPKSEDFNLKSQVIRAATSIALNVAEGSTSQSDAEQARFLGMSIRSLIETVACLRIMARRNYIVAMTLLRPADDQAEQLPARLQAFRHAIHPHQLREYSETYGETV